jgi:hypothetical protein
LPTKGRLRPEPKRLESTEIGHKARLACPRAVNCQQDSDRSCQAACDTGIPRWPPSFAILSSYLPSLASRYAEMRTAPLSAPPYTRPTLAAERAAGQDPDHSHLPPRLKRAPQRSLRREQLYVDSRSACNRNASDHLRPWRSRYLWRLTELRSRYVSYSLGGCGRSYSTISHS